MTSGRAPTTLGQEYLSMQNRLGVLLPMHSLCGSNSSHTRFLLASEYHSFFAGVLNLRTVIPRN